MRIFPDQALKDAYALGHMIQPFAAGGPPMRYTGELDEALIGEAMKLSGLNTKRETVEFALRLVLETSKFDPARPLARRRSEAELLAETRAQTEKCKRARAAKRKKGAA